MIEILKPDIIDIEGGTNHLSKFAPNIPEDAIKNVLNDISKAKDKKQHVIFKDLHKKKEVVAKKVDEPEKQVTKLKTKDFKKDYAKIVSAN